MSVFLRWGVFGIIAFAALIYAYNAGKRVSERREARAATAAPAPGSSMPGSSTSGSSTQSAEPHAPVDYGPPVPDYCADELAVAQRAREAHNQNEPYDRVLRMQEIVFADERRKRRLEQIANHFFYMQSEPSQADMNRYVTRYCSRPRQ